MSKLDEPITFLASFPPIQSAIKTGRDGARVQLDVPASEMVAIVRMVALQTGARLLKVTIELENDPQTLTGFDANETQEETKRSGISLDLRRFTD